MEIVIVGAGIAGTASALALSKWVPKVPQIKVIELRSSPSTIGGAIGLTPNALRALSALGVMNQIEQKQLGTSIDRIEMFDVYSAGSLGTIDFVGPDGQGVGQPPFKGLRILRSDLLDALLNTVKQHPNVTIEYGRTITRISEIDNKTTLDFADGSSSLSADLVIGADGIHSIVRKLHIEPERVPEYTGIAAVGGFANNPPDARLQWKDTALSQSLRGSLLCSYFEKSRTQQFIAAVMETDDVKSREGWIAMGKEQEDIKRRVKERYLGDNIKMTAVPPLVEASHSWNLYPVYTLAPKGKWSTARVILIGDAAHAVSQ